VTPYGEPSKLLDRGGRENNPIFGSHPSPGKLAGINAGIFAGEVILFRYTEHSKRKWLRWIGRGYITYAVEEHYRLGACNAGINTLSTTVQNCRPLISTPK
jgi:hypothetical protein